MFNSIFIRAFGLRCVTWTCGNACCYALWVSHAVPPYIPLLGPLHSGIRMHTDVPDPVPQNNVFVRTSTLPLLWWNVAFSCIFKIMRSRLVENNQRIYACNRGDTSKSFASCCARTFQKDAGACEAPSKKRMLDTGSETKKIAPMAFKLDWTWIELFLADHVHQEMLQQATSQFQQILRNIAEQIAVQPYAHTSDMLFQWSHAPLASPVVIFSSEDRLHLRVVGGPPSYTWFPVACTCKHAWGMITCNIAIANAFHTAWNAFGCAHLPGVTLSQLVVACRLSMVKRYTWCFILCKLPVAFMCRHLRRSATSNSWIMVPAAHHATFKLLGAPLHGTHSRLRISAATLVKFTCVSTHVWCCLHCVH